MAAWWNLPNKGDSADISTYRGGRNGHPTTGWWELPTMIFEYDQWAVSETGMQSVVPYAPYVYKIRAADFLLTVLRGNRQLYFWVMRPADKRWINIESFLACFTRALDVHEDENDWVRDQEVLLESFEKARDIANETLTTTAAGL